MGVREFIKILNEELAHGQVDDADILFSQDTLSHMECMAIYMSEDRTVMWVDVEETP